MEEVMKDWKVELTYAVLFIIFGMSSVALAAGIFLDTQVAPIIKEFLSGFVFVSGLFVILCGVGGVWFSLILRRESLRLRQWLNDDVFPPYEVIVNEVPVSDECLEEVKGQNDSRQEFV